MSNDVDDDDRFDLMLNDDDNDDDLDLSQYLEEIEELDKDVQRLLRILQDSAWTR